jgi:cysteine desulfurase
MLTLPIYMDNQATTPVDPRVLQVMLPYFHERFGNAASHSHAFGREAEAAVEAAREQVARLLRAEPREIVFTSGATEANNLAIKGLAEQYRDQGNHLVTSAVEHPSVLDACRHLERHGFRVTYLPVGGDGLVRVEDLHDALEDHTILVSIMAANNEIGTLNPIREMGQLCRARRVLFHTDATQALGKVPLDARALKIDLLSCSAHKIYGPKGVGALYVRRQNPRVRLAAQLDGGGHERGMRSGTLNVPGIVGFGEAAALCAGEMEGEGARLLELRERLRRGIMDGLDSVRLNGHPTRRLPGNLNLSFARVEGGALLMALDDVALSSGSACTSDSLEPSYVLQALGVADDLAHASLRFGLGRFNTAEEVDYVVERIIEVVGRLRRLRAAADAGWETADDRRTTDDEGEESQPSAVCRLPSAVCTLTDDE